MDQDRPRLTGVKDRSVRDAARRGSRTVRYGRVVVAMGLAGAVLGGCASHPSVSETGNGLRPAATTATMLVSCPPTAIPTNQPDTATATDSAGATPAPLPIDVQASSATGDPNAVRTDGVLEAPSAILVGPAASSAAASSQSSSVIQPIEPANPTPVDSCGGAG